jgi:probable rRNA maturation factor
MDITINYEYGREDVGPFPLRELAGFVIEQEGKPANTEASISFVDDSEIARLNETYRQKQGPTDVLSFECDGCDDGFDDSEALLGNSDGEDAAIPFELGDIVIATDVAKRQTREFGTTLQEEVELLLTHGLLHLCGYDHIEDDEAEIMEARERELLAAWRSR